MADQTFAFTVRSSSGDGSYSLSAATTTDGRVRFVCDCAAGSNGQACRHLMGLLNGDLTEMTEGEVADVEAVIALFRERSALHHHLANIVAAEAEMSSIKRRISKEKKLVNACLHGLG